MADLPRLHQLRLLKPTGTQCGDKTLLESRLDRAQFNVLLWHESMVNRNPCFASPFSAFTFPFFSLSIFLARATNLTIGPF